MRSTRCFRRSTPTGSRPTRSSTTRTFRARWTSGRTRSPASCACATCRPRRDAARSVHVADGEPDALDLIAAAVGLVVVEDVVAERPAVDHQAGLRADLEPAEVDHGADRALHAVDRGAHRVALLEL